MKQRILVDTSSFVDYFRSAKESIIPALAIEDGIILSKVVRLELLKGTRREERKLLMNFLEGLYALNEFPSADLVEKLLMQLHGRGINLGLPDLLILTDTIRSKSRLLSADKSLSKAANMLGVACIEKPKG